MIGAAQLASYSGERAQEIVDHPVGIGMVDVEAVEFAVGWQVDASLALNVEDDAGGIGAGLFAGQGREPVRNRIGTNGCC